MLKRPVTQQQPKIANPSIRGANPPTRSANVLQRLAASIFTRPAPLGVQPSAAGPNGPSPASLLSSPKRQNQGVQGSMSNANSQPGYVPGAFYRERPSLLQQQERLPAQMSETQVASEVRLNEIMSRPNMREDFYRSLGNATQFPLDRPPMDAPRQSKNRIRTPGAVGAESQSESRRLIQQQDPRPVPMSQAQVAGETGLNEIMSRPNMREDFYRSIGSNTQSPIGVPSTEFPLQLPNAHQPVASSFQQPIGPGVRSYEQSSFENPLGTGSAGGQSSATLQMPSLGSLMPVATAMPQTGLQQPAIVNSQSMPADSIGSLQLAQSVPVSENHSTPLIENPLAAS